MNIRTVNLYLLTMLLVPATACVLPAEQKQQSITRTWSAEAIRNVEVREVDGSVIVEAGAPEKVVMTASIRSNSSKPPSELFTTELEGSTLSIRRQGTKNRRFRFILRDRTTINYVLQVPPSVAMDIRTVNGRIRTTGVDGEAELTVVNGSIDFESSGANEITAKTVNGNVRARFRDSFQGASLKTVNGAVRAVLPVNASFTCDLSQVNGDFEASFPVSIHSNPGNRRVSGEVNGGRYELKIVTVNGDIELKNTQPATAPRR
jgi:hypothetical protein